MKRIILSIIVVLITLSSCTFKEPTIEPSTKIHINIPEPSDVIVPETKVEPRLPEFKTGIEVETPQGCKEGKTRGVDC
jgi:hypothetical protein